MGINFMDLVETVFRICNFVDNNPITKYQEICTSMNTEFQGWTHQQNPWKFRLNKF